MLGEVRVEDSFLLLEEEKKYVDYLLSDQDNDKSNLKIQKLPDSIKHIVNFLLEMEDDKEYYDYNREIFEGDINVKDSDEVKYKTFICLGYIYHKLGDYVNSIKNFFNAIIEYSNLTGLDYGPNHKLGKELYPILKMYKDEKLITNDNFVKESVIFYEKLNGIVDLEAS